MRKPEYLSPTSIDLFWQDREAFYHRYLSEIRPARDKQTPPMAIGSAFDTYVKCDLYRKFHGTVPPEWEFDYIFEKQVEPQNRDWARKHGKFAYYKYEQSGALADLLLELEQAIGTPHFELDLQGLVYGDLVDGIPLLGKPDLYFTNKAGRVVIYDWKVNGYCSKYNTSPAKGYLCQKGHKETGPHKDCLLMDRDGLVINGRHFLEDVDPKWGAQLAVYGWLCGESIGAEFITGIDQLVCNPSGADVPTITVAKHRVLVGTQFQKQLWDNIKRMWYLIGEKHIFDDLPLDKSQEKCEMMDEEIRLMSEDPEFFKMIK